MPILDSRTLEFVSRSPEQTSRLGMRLGALLQLNDVICLSGELGSGKTTLIKGISQGWGSLDEVTSPTFVLVNQYRLPEDMTMYHLDAYRLNNSLEAEELDVDLMLEDGILLVEWAERISSILPEENLWISMSWIADEQRRLIFQPSGQRYEELLLAFRQKAFGG
jgi:tRNA threonylcarbamoyladenosine biosynthesis protein TsaE